MFFKDFGNAISAYFTAFGLISKLKLWKYFFVPAIMGLVVGVFVLWEVYALADGIGEKIASYWPFEIFSSIINKLSYWLGGFILLIFGLITFKHIVQALSSPFMGPVSEKIEEYITGKKIQSNSFMVLLFRGIKINFRNLIREILFTLPLMLIGLIPIVGIVTTIWIFYIQSYYAGYGNMDYTMERYLNYNESITFVKRNRGIAVGNGLVFTFMLFIPVIGIILTLPISTVAATTQTLKKLEEENKLKII